MIAPPVKLCRHCGLLPVRRPRGLCWGCYSTPGVRDSFPVLGPSANRGHGHALGRAARPLPEPTAALPGTAEKLAVLERRAALSLALWHPRDARYDGQRVRRVMARDDAGARLSLLEVLAVAAGEPDDGGDDEAG